MNPTKPRWLSLASLAWAIACTPASSVPARRPPPTPTAGTLVAGTSGDYPPLSTWTADRPAGFAPALVEAFAKHEQRELSWHRFRWPELGSDLATRRFVLAADGITVRADRSLAGRFTVPIARGGAILLVRHPPMAAAGSDAGNAAARARALDRAGLRIVVNRGGHLEHVTRGLFHAAEIRAIPDNRTVRDAFAHGGADAAMTNTFEAPGWAAGLTDVEAIGPLTNDVTALWLAKDEDDLATKLDDFLLDEEESGRLAALRLETLGAAAAGAPTARPVSALLAATRERLALMPLVAAAKAKTAAAVADPAQEDRVLAAAAAAVDHAAAARHISPPRRSVTDRFFRAQIEAAKRVQTTAPPTDAPSPSLDDLRAAIARITSRMARMLVRVPPGTTPAAVEAEAKDWLRDTGLDPASLTEISTSIATAAP